MKNKKSSKSLKTEKITIKNSKTEKNHNIAIKIILIGIFIFATYTLNLSYENTIHLLAVTQDDKGKDIGGSIVDLSLKIKPGSGQTFVNLNTIREVDTQISLINSQKSACLIFKLDCSKYDFYYSFDNSALILKGPSASSAIAILTAKTINKIPINDQIAITGTLSSGGLIGSVGGINQKIKIANKFEYKKVLVPFFSKYNESENVEIIPILDIISAYNEFGGDNYSIQTKIKQSKEYANTMKTLSEQMCARSQEIKLTINYKNISINNTLHSNLNSAKKSYNSSRLSYTQKNYYSTGSFCFNSNINYRIIREIQKNLSKSELNSSIKKLESSIRLKEKEILNISKHTSSLNDFYVTLLLFDRVNDAKELLKISKKTLNTNKSDLQRSTVSYSQAKERFYTINLWQTFIQNKNSIYSFNPKILNSACKKITKDIEIKSKLLKNENINIFDELLNKQKKTFQLNQNNYLCIYKGLELLGRMDTFLNYVGIDKNQSVEYITNLLDFTQKRISLNSNGDFPFIPYIYSEYSSDLFKSKDSGAAILYANYALSYSDLNLYLENKQKLISKSREIFIQLFENTWFVLGILLLIGFV